MKSSFLRIAALLALAGSSVPSFAQGIGGVGAASNNVTAGATPGVSPSVNTDIPAATAAVNRTTAPMIDAVAPPLTAKQKAALQRDYELFGAANAGETWHIRELLGKGAHIEAADWQYGFTPLMWAAKNGHVGAVRYLLSRGAKANATSKRGVSLTFPEKAVATDIQGATMWTQSSLVSESGGITALHAATAAGWGLAARELIARGADVNATNPDGDTPLMAAAYHNDLLTLKALIAKGAKTGAVDKYGRGSLWLAAWRGNESVVRELLARGAKPTPDATGIWPGDAARMAKNNGVAAVLARAEKSAKAAQGKTIKVGAPSSAPGADKAMTDAARSGIIILN